MEYCKSIQRGFRVAKYICEAFLFFQFCRSTI